MNDTAGIGAHAVLDTNHEHIFLSPRCEDERTWCQDDIGPCDECGEPTVNYVRADIAEAQLLAARQEIERLTNNRDMWKGQSERQAADLLMMHLAAKEARNAE